MHQYLNLLYLSGIFSWSVVADVLTCVYRKRINDNDNKFCGHFKKDDG